MKSLLLIGVLTMVVLGGDARLSSAQKVSPRSLTVLNALQGPSRWQTMPKWGQYFRQAGANGSFLLYDLKANRAFVFNAERANTRYLPASTFKILNSLIALDARAVRDENEVLRWDGVKREFPVWNRDQDMKSAIQNSTIWFYQEMARRVGESRMAQQVRTARYGNADIRGGIDHFWLNGQLRISSREQIEFLVRLYKNQLTFSTRAQGIVKRILIVPDLSKRDQIFRAKTGFAGVTLGLPSGSLPIGPKIGWWVGYVQRSDAPYFFAMNLDMKRDSDAVVRKNLTLRILRSMQILKP